MEDGQVEARTALVKFGLFALTIAVVLGLVTYVAVRALGISGSGSGGGHHVSAATATPSQLPTVAITPSGAASASATPSETPSATPTGIQLTAPAQAAAGSHITLSGQYPTGADGVRLQVQRMTGTTWGPFANVTVPVRAGAFSTYIITSQRGPTSFRLLDPTTGTASNIVQVTIS